MPRLDWVESLRYMTADPAWKRKVALGGLFILAIPPVGWVMALGFRSLAGQRLTEGATSPLPSWEGNFRAVFARGVKSCGVILGYLSPSIRCSSRLSDDTILHVADQILS